MDPNQAYHEFKLLKKEISDPLTKHIYHLMITTWDKQDLIAACTPATIYRVASMLCFTIMSMG